VTGCVITTATNGATLECSIETRFTSPIDHPGDAGDRCPRRPGWVNPHTLTQHAVTGARGLAAVHALYTADHAKYVANILAAVAAFKYQPA
jgi:hypothetical protein